MHLFNGLWFLYYCSLVYLFFFNTDALKCIALLNSVIRSHFSFLLFFSRWKREWSHCKCQQLLENCGLPGENRLVTPQWPSSIRHGTNITRSDRTVIETELCKRDGKDLKSLLQRRQNEEEWFLLTRVTAAFVVVNVVNLFRLLGENKRLCWMFLIRGW